jgi:acid phosphatase (class A)
VEREESFSYPSGHATRGVLAARVLAELAPARRAELLRLGEQVGYDRVVGGVHYPSDVLAGQRLGAALADELLARPELAAELAAVRAAEWTAPAAAAPAR